MTSHSSYYGKAPVTPPPTPPSQQQPVSYSSPPSPRTYSSPRRSSICTPTNIPSAVPHRRTRSFRDPKSQYALSHHIPRPLRPVSPSSSSTTAFDFELCQRGSSVSCSTRPQPFPLQKLNRTSSSSSNSVSTATTFFNTSTESNSSSGGGGGGNRSGSTRMSSAPSNWSVSSSEYSTTSSSKRECVARVQAAGGKLAYLASRRGSIGSNCSSVCSTPPNTPGIAQFTTTTTSTLKGRRQSSGNYLEVPLTPSFTQQQQQQQQGGASSSSSSHSTPVSPSRPRVNSLPATSIVSSANLLSPTTYFSDPHQPYNPRSTMTKSQDYLYRLRTFNITKQGDVVNCGDTFVRKSKSNNSLSQAQDTSPRKFSLSTSPTRSQRSSPCRRGSLSPRLVVNYPLLDASCCVSRESTTGDSSPAEVDDDDDDEDDFEDDELTMRELISGGGEADPQVRYRVVLLGESGVGKSALVRQFMTSEYINTYDMSLDEEYGEREVSVLLDAKQSQLVFIDHPCVEMSVENSLSTYEPHACVVVYSVTDKRSFEFAAEIVRYLWQEGTTHDRSVILVGNKCDLARARVISTQEGKNLATSHDTKFIETSSGIQHNVDELLVGVLKQIRLREEAVLHHAHNQTSSSVRLVDDHQQTQYKHTKRRGGHTPRGSIMSLLFTRELINKLCFLSKKAKSCENLHVL